MNNREYLYQVDRLANGGEPGQPIPVPEWQAPEITSTRPTAPVVTTGPSASQQYAEYISQQPPSQSPGFVLPSQTFENNAQAYLERNPDVRERYSDAGREMGLSLYDWARWHYDNHGQMEGRLWEVPAATNAVGFAGGGLASLSPAAQPAPVMGMAYMSPEARSYLANQLGSVNMDYLPQAQRDALMRYRQGLERAQDPNRPFFPVG